MTTFADRAGAGARLAQELGDYSPDDTVVCGIPRGGAIVAAETARAGEFDYECLVICRIGMPCFPEVTLGAIDADGEVLFDPQTQLTRFELAQVGDSIMQRLAGRVAMCRGDRSEPDFAGKTVVVVDEYVGDPLVALKAAQYLRKHGAAKVVLATPALAGNAASALEAEYDATVALSTPPEILTASDVYQEAEDPSDDEISASLQAAWSGLP